MENLMENLNLDKITGGQFLTYLFTLFAVIIPGLGLILFANPDLFFNLEIAKLLLLAAFYSVPLFSLSFVAAVLRLHVPNMANWADSGRQMTFEACLITLLLFSIDAMVLLPLKVIFWGNKNTDPQVLIVALAYGIPVILCLLFILFLLNPSRYQNFYDRLKRNL